MAGRLAIEQSAYKGALVYLNNALHLIQRLPESQERDQSELGIQIDYGLAMLAVKGWYAPEYGGACQRAHEICRILGGSDPRLFSILSGLANFYNQLPETQTSLSYSDEMLRLARTAEDSEMLTQAHWAYGRSKFFIGDLVHAHDNFELCLRSYDPKKHRTLSIQAGQDPGVLARIFDAMTLWILGYADRAQKRADESIALARQLRSPLTLVNCLCMTAKYDSIRHDFKHAASVIEEGFALSNEHDFGYYKQGLVPYQKIGLAAMGKVAEPKTPTVAGRNDKLSGVRYEVAQTFARSYLAEGLGGLGRVDTALDLVSQAADLMEHNNERYVEPEIHRIKGELLLRRALESPISAAEVESAESSAEESFRSAIETARVHSAKSFELRASLSLSQLLKRRNRKTEAEQILGPLYNWFTEGFDMPELKEAKKLLDELGSS